MEKKTSKLSILTKGIIKENPVLVLLLGTCPTLATTSSAMAGALGVQLAGPAWYFGIRVEKPTIGEHQRPIVPEDILRSNRLLYGGSVLCLGVLIGLRCALVLGGGIG